jgi:hypothetical protein
MKFTTIRTVTVAALACVATASIAIAAESKIKDVMKEAMKGDTSLFKKVSLGKGTDEDAQKLLEYVKSLPDQEPPKGDKAAWEDKTHKLVQAAEDFVAKKPDAQTALQKAGNCKACHSEHKPK